MELVMTRKSVRVCGGQTAYWECSPERQDSLIILHGFRGNHRALIPMSRHLSAYRIILPDRPGYGESDRLDKQHTLLNYSHWLDEFIGRLDLARFSVWGHSNGATIALIQAAQGHRKPSATVAVSVALLPGSILQRLTTSYYQLGRVMPTTLRKLWLTNRVMANTSGRVLFKTTRGQELNALLSEGILDLRSINPDVILEEYFNAIHTDLDPYVSSISAPILFVAGARDIIAPLSQVRSLASKARRGTLQIMSDQGHMAPIEAPGATAALTGHFLNSIGAHQ
jgi:pimeloyl-ACP methyl ester carboxylesterase